MLIGAARRNIKAARDRIHSTRRELQWLCQRVYALEYRHDYEQHYRDRVMAEAALRYWRRAYDDLAQSVLASQRVMAQGAHMWLHGAMAMANRLADVPARRHL